MAENVFGGFAEGLNQGASWAAKQTELDLSRKRVEQEQEQHDEQKRQFNATLGKQYSNDLYSASTMAPGKTKSAYIKRIADQAKESGINLDPTLLAGLDDPNYQPMFAKIKQGMDGVAVKDPKMYDDMISNMIPALGAKDVMTTLIPKMADNMVKLQEAAAANKAKKQVEVARVNRQNSTDIRTTNTIFTDPALRKEVVKLNAAQGAQSLVDKIRSGDIKDSKNISTQLTNLISTIEFGGANAASDRQSMGVDTLYTRAKALESFLSSEPNSAIPPKYLDQLEVETDALGDRAVKNYKNMTDAAIAGTIGSDLEKAADDPDAPSSNITKFARARQTQFLKGYGYDPETLERVAKTKKATTGPESTSSAAAAAPQNKKIASQRDAKLERLKSIYTNTPQGAARDKISTSPAFQALTPADRAYITGNK